MARKKRTNWKLPLSMTQLQRLAGILIEDADPLIVGARMTGSSGVWKKANGTLIARFAYRRPSGTSIVYTIRDIVVPAAQLEGESV